MAFMKKILYLECIPKKEGFNEGIVISEYAKLAWDDKVEFWQIQSKREFFDVLAGNHHKYIHISAHGECDDNGDYCISLPKGRVYPEEFNPNSGLRKRICFISACSLGKKRFAESLFEAARPEVLIAPQRDIYFLDAATFWITLYYHHFYLERTLEKSFDKACEMVKNTGAMQFWY